MSTVAFHVNGPDDPVASDPRNVSQAQNTTWTTDNPGAQLRSVSIDHKQKALYVELHGHDAIRITVQYRLDQLVKRLGPGWRLIEDRPRGLQSRADSGPHMSTAVQEDVIHREREQEQLHSISLPRLERKQAHATGEEQSRATQHAQERADEFVGIVQPLTSPLVVFVRHDDLKEAKSDDDWLLAMAYSMGEKRVVFWLRFQPSTKRIERLAACQYRLGQLNQMLVGWRSAGYSYASQLAKDRMVEARRPTLYVPMTWHEWLRYHRLMTKDPPWWLTEQHLDEIVLPELMAIRRAEWDASPIVSDEPRPVEALPWSAKRRKTQSDSKWNGPEEEAWIRAVVNHARANMVKEFFTVKEWARADGVARLLLPGVVARARPGAQWRDVSRNIPSLSEPTFMDKQDYRRAKYWLAQQTGQATQETARQGGFPDLDAWIQQGFTAFTGWTDQDALELGETYQMKWDEYITMLREAVTAFERQQNLTDTTPERVELQTTRAMEPTVLLPTEMRDVRRFAQLRNISLQEASDIIDAKRAEIEDSRNPTMRRLRALTQAVLQHVDKGQIYHGYQLERIPKCPDKGTCELHPSDDPDHALLCDLYNPTSRAEEALGSTDLT